MSNKAKTTLIILASLVVMVVISFLSISVFKAYAVHYKYKTCLAWEYNFEIENYVSMSVAVIDEPDGFEGTKKYIFENGSYMLVYPDDTKTYYCQQLNCFYSYEDDILVSLYFSMDDFPGESYVVYDLK